MSSTLTTVAGVCNYSLAKIGYKLRIGSLFDGSMAAKKALDVYSQTRDATLREFTWNFAQKEIAATASGGTAPPPWQESYAYPADCIQVRSLKPGVYDPNNPIPSLWAVGDDPIYGKVVWSYLPTAVLVYTAQITDPTVWEPLFLEAIAAKLGNNLRSLVESDANVMKLMEEVEMAETKIAAETVG